MSFLAKFVRHVNIFLASRFFDAATCGAIEKLFGMVYSLEHWVKNKTACLGGSAVLDP